MPQPVGTKVPIMTFGQFLKADLRTLRDYWWVLILLLAGAAILDAFPGSLIVKFAKAILYSLAAVGIPISILGQRHALRVWGGNFDARMAFLRLNPLEIRALIASTAPTFIITNATSKPTPPRDSMRLA
jgi:hypothetical protein